MAHNVETRPIDVYRDYVLGTQIKTLDEIRNALKCVFFDEWPDKICDEIESRILRRAHLSDEEYYNLKNESMEKSIALTSAIDSQFLSMLFENFETFEKPLGDEVLVVGCEAGVEACYIAMLYPDKHIVGIDKCAPAIENAKALASKFDIHNAEFFCAPIDLFKHEPFDSIVSVRVAHENLSSAIGLLNPFKPLEEKSQLAFNDLKTYGKKLSGLLKDGGWLASCEHLVNGELYGYLKRLYTSGICDLAVSIFDISDTTDDSFFAFVDGYKKSHDNNVYTVWKKAQDVYCNSNGGEVHGAAAEYLKYSRVGKLIYGFEASKGKVLCARVGLYESVKDKLAAYYNYDASNAQAVMKSLREAETNYRLNPGFSVKRLGLEDFNCCDDEEEK
ncbi:MAG: class I SAM-dependent methyltransferase [Oscillospiraceae bacterium]|nr:class I SAM-dependent methyltransferase [Oscillospiraceae bacterium]